MTKAHNTCSSYCHSCPCELLFLTPRSSSSTARVSVWILWPHVRYARAPYVRTPLLSGWVKSTHSLYRTSLWVFCPDIKMSHISSDVCICREIGQRLNRQLKDSKVRTRSDCPGGGHVFFPFIVQILLQVFSDLTKTGNFKCKNNIIGEVQTESTNQRLSRGQDRGNLK